MHLRQRTSRRPVAPHVAKLALIVLALGALGFKGEACGGSSRSPSTATPTSQPPPPT